MYESLNFPGSLFVEFDRFRRELDDVFGAAPAAIRANAPGTYPAINVGHTPASVEIQAFAPGLDASRIEITIDRGVLTLSGERASSLPTEAQVRERKQKVHAVERGHGSFMRSVSLPEDADASNVTATYRDGVLQVSVARKAAPQPRRIAVQ